MKITAKAVRMIKGIRKEAYDCEPYISGRSMDEVMEEYELTQIRSVLQFKEIHQVIQLLCTLFVFLYLF